MPTIEEAPESVLVGIGLGRSASFTCTAYGGPLDSLSLVFTWSGPMGVDISNVDTLSDRVTSILTIVNVTEDFIGNYSCSVAYSDRPHLLSTSEGAILGGISK